MNGMNAFERSVKDSLESYEVPYNSADWAQLEKALDQGDGSGRVSRSGLYALLLGGSIAAASSMYMLLSPVPELSGPASNSSTFVDRTIGTNSFEQPSTEHALAIVDPRTSLNTSTNSPEVGIGIEPEQSASEAIKNNSVPLTVEGTKPAAGRPAPSTGPIVRPSVTEGCPGTSIDFAVENTPEGGIYLWNFGDGSFSNKPSPSHAFSKSGNFEVMLSHSSPGGGTIHNKPAADRIIIHEAPEAAFNLLKQEYDNTVPSVHFENRSMRGRSYEWDFGDGTTSTIAHPDHVYKKQGIYQVSLTVTNANGCVDRTERSVRIDSDYDLMAPKTFSPNGDGVDDVFMPEALKTLGVKFNLSVFEAATGQLVYETTDAQRPWNGKVNNRGDQCVSGDYVWMVEMKDGEKLGGTYNGSLDLVR